MYAEAIRAFKILSGTHFRSFHYITLCNWCDSLYSHRLYVQREWKARKSVKITLKYRLKAFKQLNSSVALFEHIFCITLPCWRISFLREYWKKAERRKRDILPGKRTTTKQTLKVCLSPKNSSNNLKNHP